MSYDATHRVAIFCTVRPLSQAATLGSDDAVEAEVAEAAAAVAAAAGLQIQLEEQEAILAEAEAARGGGLGPTHVWADA